MYQKLYFGPMDIKVLSFFKWFNRLYCAGAHGNLDILSTFRVAVDVNNFPEDINSTCATYSD